MKPLMLLTNSKYVYQLGGWIVSIHESPVELIHTPSTDSSTLTMMITDCLLRITLLIGQCRGQA